MFSSFHPSTGLTQRYLYVFLSFFPLPSPPFQSLLCTLHKLDKRLGKTTQVVKCVVLTWVLSAPCDGICPHDAFLSRKVHWVLWRLPHRLPGSPIVWAQRAYSIHLHIVHLAHSNDYPFLCRQILETHSILKN